MFVAHPSPFPQAQFNAKTPTDIIVNAGEFLFLFMKHEMHFCMLPAIEVEAAITFLIALQKEN